MVNNLQDPQEVDSWTGLLNATVPGPPCLQHITQSFLTTGEEDCLYLNVFTPIVRHTSILSKKLISSCLDTSIT